jgi:hypothetical protein
VGGDSLRYRVSGPGNPHHLESFEFCGRCQLTIAHHEGQRFLFLVPQQQEAPDPITVVVNWQQALRR